MIMLNIILAFVVVGIGWIITMIIFNLFISDSLNKFKDECHERIKEKDEEYEKNEKVNKEIRKWLFK